MSSCNSHPYNTGWHSSWLEPCFLVVFALTVSKNMVVTNSWWLIRQLIHGVEAVIRPFPFVSKLRRTPAGELCSDSQPACVCTCLNRWSQSPYFTLLWTLLELFTNKTNPTPWSSFCQKPCEFSPKTIEPLWRDLIEGGEGGGQERASRD